jgi:RNA polymerase sigma-70 factor (ECF subfamily)
VFSLNPTFVELETPDTRSLLDQARAGDTEAFCEICRVYETRLLRQAVALCRNTTLAEDLAQDTLIDAWKCLRRYNGRCQFFTWLCAILLNRYRNTIRRKRPLFFSTLSGHDRDEFQNRIDNLPGRDFPPNDAVELREEAELVRKCIEKLPAKHQQVIYLRFYAGDSLEGIAAALGCSVGTVKSRLFHALDKLRAMNALSAQFAHVKTKGGPL